jgi:hypothetical protein
MKKIKVTKEMIERWEDTATESLKDVITSAIMVEGEKSAIAKKVREIIASRK